ncbi:hypothetical protein PMAYCL1PPCAC_21357, partial [Pristionchus mayeri]
IIVLLVVFSYAATACPLLGECTQRDIDERWGPGRAHGTVFANSSGAFCAGATPQFVFAKRNGIVIVANAFKCINGEWNVEYCFGSCNTQSLREYQDIITTKVCCMSR